MNNPLINTMRAAIGLTDSVPETPRWSVFLNREFLGSVRAASQSEAEEMAYGGRFDLTTDEIDRRALTVSPYAPLV